MSKTRYLVTGGAGFIGSNLVAALARAGESVRAYDDLSTGRWALLDLEVLHRVGALAAAEPIVFVGVTSRHRRDAFEACEYIMDQLKTRAPFWKRERTPHGWQWVAARETDSQAAARW